MSISSNTCPEAALGRLSIRSIRPQIFGLLFLAAACVAGTPVGAYAIDPTRATSLYVHDRWNGDSGFPGGQVYAITQTSDGYLWIGAEKGLVRFDGLNFWMIDHLNTPSLPAGPVIGLTADALGNLWIRQPELGVLRYRDGAFEQMMADPARVESQLTAMCKGNDGNVVIASLGSVTTYQGRQFSELATRAALPTFIVTAMIQAPGGDIWMGTREAGLFRLSAGEISRVTNEGFDRKINCVVTIDDGELWAGTDDGVIRWSKINGLQAGLAASGLDRIQVLAMIRDRDSNMWAGTSSGLFRISPRAASSPNKAAPLIEQSELATDWPVSTLFEDREGNLWLGGNNGLERLRDTQFITYSTANGLPSDHNGPVYAGPDGRIWFAPVEGGLYWMSNGKVHKVNDEALAGDVIYSIAGRDNELWVGRQRGGLTHLILNGDTWTSTTYTQANGLPQNSVYAVCHSHDGTVWAGTLSGGVSRCRDGKFTTYTASSGLASNTVTCILEGAEGAMWFATSGGLTQLSNGQWRTYTSRDGLPSDTVNCLFQDSSGVLWIGTVRGLAFYNSGRLQVPVSAPQTLNDQVLGITEDSHGSLWIATSSHLLRAKQESLLWGKVEDGDVREYGPADGLHSFEGVKRSRSAVTAPSGQIWFSTNRGISVVDPARLARDLAPAIVDIQTVSVDGGIIDTRGSIRLPPGSRRITFAYAGLSFSAQERVRFRYMLEGFDHNWSEPVASHQADYTNLGPGHYRFRIIASNSEGQWNSAEASIGFELEPVFWQTLWFEVLCSLAAASAALVIYRFRLRRLARQLNLRFEERLAERTLIAQDLHDTLLQGFLSASMQLHAAVERLPADTAARPALARVLQLMREVTEEGRNAVRGLRSVGAVQGLNLEQAFSRVQEELGLNGGTGFRVVVEGRNRPLHPIIRDEVYRIGREALVNAFRHSRARSVEVEVEYTPKHLRVLIRDDGRGIDPTILDAGGREGHWGLSGMRERAEGINSRLRLWSRAGAGTEVELYVPANVAFESRPKSRPLKWASRFFRPGIRNRLPFQDGAQENGRPTKDSGNDR